MLLLLLLLLFTSRLVFCHFNSFGAIWYFQGALARYIFAPPKYHKTRSIRLFWPSIPTQYMDFGPESNSRAALFVSVKFS